MLQIRLLLLLCCFFLSFLTRASSFIGNAKYRISHREVYFSLAQNSIQFEMIFLHRSKIQIKNTKYTKEERKTKPKNTGSKTEISLYMCVVDKKAMLQLNCKAVAVSYFRFALNIFQFCVFGSFFVCHVFNLNGFSLSRSVLCVSYNQWKWK